MKLKVSFAVSFWVCCLFASVCVAGQNTINHKNFYQLTGDLLNTKMLEKFWSFFLNKRIDSTSKYLHVKNASFNL